MKDRKKGKGVKTKVRAYKKKKRSTYIAAAVTVAIIVLVVVISGVLIYSSLNQPQGSGLYKAAIVDQLSIYTPNQTFVQTAVSILDEARFNVDYYYGSLVTVEFYRRLPTHGYNLIVLRVHSVTHGLGGKLHRTLHF